MRSLQYCDNFRKNVVEPLPIEETCLEQMPIQQKLACQPHKFVWNDLEKML